MMHPYLYSMRWFCESSFCLNLICNEIGQIFLTRFNFNRLYIISFIGTFNTTKKRILAKNVLTFAPNYSNTHLMNILHWVLDKTYLVLLFVTKQTSFSRVYILKSMYTLWWMVRLIWVGLFYGYLAPAIESLTALSKSYSQKF